MFLIEIIALIFLCKKNGELAVQKGLKPKTWKIYTVVAWIMAEFTGCIFAVLLFIEPGQLNIKDMPQSTIAAVSLVSLFAAFGGYLFVRYTLEKKPSGGLLDKDVNRVSVDDLAPPKK
jgi:hypothetical protein